MFEGGLTLLVAVTDISRHLHGPSLVGTKNSFGHELSSTYDCSVMRISTPSPRTDGPMLLLRDPEKPISFESLSTATARSGERATGNITALAAAAVSSIAARRVAAWLLPGGETRQRGVSAAASVGSASISLQRNDPATR